METGCVALVGDTFFRALVLMHLSVSVAESYRATSTAGASTQLVAQQLRCYFVFKCSFPTLDPALDLTQPIDIKLVSDASFLEKATQNTLDIYQEVMDEALQRYGVLVYPSQTLY